MTCKELQHRVERVRPFSHESVQGIFKNQNFRMGDLLPNFLTLLAGGNDVVFTNEDLRRALNFAEPISRIMCQQAVACMKVAVQWSVDLKHGLNGFFDLVLIQFTILF